ncbi:hypothetical protein [Collibacillus ludicampi]|uniref:hypothetical protein n=1 Tax=Collibacillus ludicampi TaxID=2771369 RepID=UPI002494359D|nr:hypothetical protein [Collibacillus ludicampi]
MQKEILPNRPVASGAISGVPNDLKGKHREQQQKAIEHLVKCLHELAPEKLEKE